MYYWGEWGGGCEGLLTCAMPSECTQELKTSFPPLIHQCSQGKGLLSTVMNPNIEGDFKGNKAVYWGGGMPACAIKTSPGAEDISTTDSSAQTGEGALLCTAVNLNTEGGLEKTRQCI